MRTKKLSRPRIFRSRFVALFATLGMLLLSMGGVTLAATTASADNHKVSVCHANDSDKSGKPYVYIEVGSAAADPDKASHFDHIAGGAQVKEWSIAATWNGMSFDAGDARPDYIEGVNWFTNVTKEWCEAGITDDGGEDEQAVSVSVSPTSVCVGNAVRFTIRNTGDVTTMYDGRLTGPNGSTITTFNNVSIAAGGTHPVDHTLTTVGSYTLTFWVDGNTAISDSATATATECPAGQVDVSVSPTSVCVGQQVVFTLRNTGSASTTYVGQFTAPGATPTSLGPVTLAGGASQTFTYTANTAGSYTVVFSVQGNPAVSDAATATARVCPDLPERPDALVDEDVQTRMSCPRGVEQRTVTVTTGYVWNGTAWVLGTPSAPVVSDWERVRALTPAERVALECDEVLPTEGVDLCPNLEGVQESVPPGRSLDEDGNCVRGEVKGTETASPTPGVTPVGNPPLPPQGLPTAVDAGFGGPTDTGSGSMVTVMAQLMMGAGLLFLIAAGWLQIGRQTRGVHQF